jgi:hypothetical protein
MTETETTDRYVPCGRLIGPAPDVAQPPRCELGYPIPSHCDRCEAYSPGLTEQERTRCEVWTRVMGYHRPVSACNAGKQSEHRERRAFRESPDFWETHY